MSHLINIFVEPGKTFAELKEKPTFWLPLLLLATLTAAMTLMYFSKVDSDWYLEHTIAASGNEMSAKEIENFKNVMPSAKTQGYFAAPFTYIGFAIFACLFSLYYMLAGKITGAATSFRHGISLFAWSGMPAVIGTIVAIIGVVMMTPQTGIESLALTNVDPLFVQLPMDHPWSRLAKSFSLLTLWSIALTAIGWRTWGKTSWGQAITVAIIPSLIIYGGMAAWAMMKS